MIWYSLLRTLGAVILCAPILYKRNSHRYFALNNATIILFKRIKIVFRLILTAFKPFIILSFHVKTRIQVCRAAVLWTHMFIYFCISLLIEDHQKNININFAMLITSFSVGCISKVTDLYGDWQPSKHFVDFFLGIRYQDWHVLMVVSWPII